jgi:DNA-binding winged helix-turn-helix (wHTH) protein/Tol biopolymer transport system component
MGVSYTDRTFIRFGVFELDIQTGELRKNGTRVRCQEQPLQVLAALAERPGELVTREELRRRVWPEDTFVDFDRALNTAIKKIRAALNDDADSPRYIETVPRRGYRLIMPVEQENASLHAHVERFLVTHHRLIALTVIAIIILATLGFAWRFGLWHDDASTSPRFQRLTFDLPELGGARFTPDGASVVYSAGRHPNRSNIYAQRLGAPGPQLLGIDDSALLAVSPQAELAVVSEDPDSELPMTHMGSLGTLARVPLNGGAPRELLPATEDADWSPDGELAVVRQVGDKSRLEFPVGKVLYESPGWIATPRFSPSGDSIAFLDHPVVPDDRGSVVMVDLKGNKRTLSGFWESLRGLAWSPNGNEVWFSATRSGIARALYAVTLNGQERRVMSVVGAMSLRDISRDGRVLISQDNGRLGIMYVGAGESEPRELSWEDWSMVADISPDGKRILFGAEGENSGFSYQVGSRPTDGSAGVILGAGAAQSLSPNGQWALSIMPSPNDQIVLLPTGTGSAKTLERGSIDHYGHTGAKWFPDGSQIVFVGFEAGHGPRCYVQSVETGRPRPFTPDGMVLCSVSPAGNVLAITRDSRALLYNSQSSERPYKELKLEKGEMPIGWTPDGKFLYLFRNASVPATITRFEVATGRRSLWKRVPLPPARTGLKCEEVVITPDGRSFAYTYSNQSSDLYLVLGLK